jgi:hypothetical protein
MIALLFVLLSFGLVYVLFLSLVLGVSILIVRQKLRKYQEAGRFGY